MTHNRITLISGISLIFLGILFFVSTLVPATWPIVLIGAGVFFLAAAVIWGLSGLTIAGAINLTLGGVLLYQTISQNWASWYYLWPLVFAGLGVGMLLTRQLEPSLGAWRGIGSRYTRVSLGFLAVGLLAAGLLWIFRAALTWPSILWGMGALFLLVALISQVGPLAIPSVFIGGLGLLLAYQNASGDWNSWAYAWALLPAFVAIGMFLAFWRSRIMRVVSLSMLSWSAALFIVFGVFFAGKGAFIQYWPVLLILGGVIVLIQSLLVRRPRRSYTA